MSPITYQQALRLGLEDSLATDPAVLLLGVGINDHLGVSEQLSGSRKHSALIES